MLKSEGGVLTFDDLVARSSALPYRIPTQANRLEGLADRRHEVEEHASGVRPIMHADVSVLIRDFLAFGRDHGTPAARRVFRDLSPVDFVSRLLTCRPLAFFGHGDSYLLRDGAQGQGGFEQLGGPRQRAPLVIEELLSYDEMAISALLGVSVPTHFFNAGSRRNGGRPGEPGSFESRGVYVGLVGARFERPECVEWRHLIVTEDQNTHGKGYGTEADTEAPATRLVRLWARFYGRETLPSFAEAAADQSGRYLRLGGGALFDRELYKRRVRWVIEPFLLDANARAEAAGRPAYVHAVGLGLGVWRVHLEQVDLMLEVYAEALRALALPRVADLDFSWFRGAEACGGVRSGEQFRAGENDIRIHFSKREPAARLAGENEGKLLVAMYAWDSNAFPGNEYWLGMLGASGDPAAACCSTIPELQNPDVNPRVSGEHLRVYGEGRDEHEGV
jgi:hypothetical protein